MHLKGLPLTSLAIPNDAKTDLGLKHYLAALETHPVLNLGEWRITGDGLVHLKGLTKLQDLNLAQTKITDAGLEHLKGLSKLQELHLESTEITDTGLLHLKGLTKLQRLKLGGTKITDAGVAELQKALPNCKISK